MAKIKWVFIASLIVMLLAIPLFTACPAEEETTPTTKPPTTAPPTTAPPPEITLYVGGTFALTGAYAEDTAVCLAGMQDYTQYVNETKLLAPWRTETFPENVTLELLWRDDELKPEKALSIYDELKAKGMLVFRISGSPQGLALKNRLNEDRMGATTMGAGVYVLSPPQTIFAHLPIYSDSVAASADWFMEQWKAAGKTAKPRVAYLTADNAMGRSIVIPEMQEYLEELGYEFVGEQYVPLVPTTPPTTQLSWLKENKVDLALGVMIIAGSESTINEAVRLDMGPDRGYKITFSFPHTTTIQKFASEMGELGNGFIGSGCYPSSWPTISADDPPGVTFCHELYTNYRDKPITDAYYMHGVVEAMIQIEALRLAMLEVPVEELKPVDVLEHGFYQIKNLDTGDLTASPLTFGPADVEGIDKVLVQQVQNGMVVVVGHYPTHHIYRHE